MGSRRGKSADGLCLRVGKASLALGPKGAGAPGEGHVRQVAGVLEMRLSAGGSVRS